MCVEVYSHCCCHFMRQISCVLRFKLFRAKSGKIVQSKVFSCEKICPITRLWMYYVLRNDCSQFSCSVLLKWNFFSFVGCKIVSLIDLRYAPLPLPFTMDSLTSSLNSMFIFSIDIVLISITYCNVLGTPYKERTNFELSLLY